MAWQLYACAPHILRVPTMEVVGGSVLAVRLTIHLEDSSSSGMVPVFAMVSHPVTIEAKPAFAVNSCGWEAAVSRVTLAGASNLVPPYLAAADAPIGYGEEPGCGWATALDGCMGTFAVPSVGDPVLLLSASIIAVDGKGGEHVANLGMSSKPLRMLARRVVLDRKVAGCIVRTPLGDVGVVLSVAPTDETGALERVRDLLDAEGGSVDAAPRLWAAGGADEIRLFGRLRRSLGGFNAPEARLKRYLRLYGLRHEADTPQRVVQAWGTAMEVLFARLACLYGPEGCDIAPAPRLDALIAHLRVGRATAERWRRLLAATSAAWLGSAVPPTAEAVDDLFDHFLQDAASEAPRSTSVAEPAPSVYLFGVPTPVSTLLSCDPAAAAAAVAAVAAVEVGIQAAPHTFTADAAIQVDRSHAAERSSKGTLTEPMPPHPGGGAVSSVVPVPTDPVPPASPQAMPLPRICSASQTDHAFPVVSVSRGCITDSNVTGLCFDTNLRGNNSEMLRPIGVSAVTVSTGCGEAPDLRTTGTCTAADLGPVVMAAAVAQLVAAARADDATCLDAHALARKNAETGRGLAEAEASALRSDLQTAAMEQLRLQGEREEWHSERCRLHEALGGATAELQSLKIEFAAFKAAVNTAVQDRAGADAAATEQLRIISTQLLEAQHAASAAAAEARAERSLRGSTEESWAAARLECERLIQELESARVAASRPAGSSLPLQLEPFSTGPGGNLDLHGTRDVIPTQPSLLHSKAELWWGEESASPPSPAMRSPTVAPVRAVVVPRGRQQPRRTLVDAGWEQLLLAQYDKAFTLWESAVALGKRSLTDQPEEEAAYDEAIGLLRDFVDNDAKAAAWWYESALRCDSHAVISSERLRALSGARVL